MFEAGVLHGAMGTGTEVIFNKLRRMQHQQKMCPAHNIQYIYIAVSIWYT